MSPRFYDTDLTDAVWDFVTPILPAVRPRPRTTNLRAGPRRHLYVLRKVVRSAQKASEQGGGGRR